MGTTTAHPTSEQKPSFSLCIFSYGMCLIMLTSLLFARCWASPGQKALSHSVGGGARMRAMLYENIFTELNLFEQIIVNSSSKARPKVYPRPNSETTPVKQMAREAHSAKMKLAEQFPKTTLAGFGRQYARRSKILPTKLAIPCHSAAASEKSD